MKFLGVILLIGGISNQSIAGKPDTYQNYADLAAHEKLGVDYTISVTERVSPISVFAIHGGGIDLNSELIAQAIADQKWSLYVFKGIKPSGNWVLHVTSAHFDEPQALALAKKSRVCLSIHGHKNDERRICIGGNNQKLREHMAAALKPLDKDFKTEMLCPGLEGTAPTNVVNECQVGGVQLEFSSALRDALFSDQQLYQRVVNTVQKGLEN